MAKTGAGRVRWLFNIVFAPKKLVNIPKYTSQSVLDRVGILISTTVFFLFNIILYALPLSLAKIGFVKDQPAHPQFEALTQGLVNNPDFWWMVLVRLVNNGIFLVDFGLLAFLLFHLGVWLTRNSNGLIPSYRTVIINTSIYLAIIFNLAWVAVASDRTPVVGDLLTWFFTNYFVTIANILSVSPPFSPHPLPSLENLSLLGEATLVGLIIPCCYYTYVLYLGAIVVHGTTRYEAVVIIGFTLTSAILFGAGAIVIQQFNILPPALSL